MRSTCAWEQPVNWKVALENYLECYHCPVAHPGFSKVIDVDPDSYRLFVEDGVLSQVGPLREEALAGDMEVGAADAAGRDAQQDLPRLRFRHRNLVEPQGLASRMKHHRAHH